MRRRGLALALVLALALAGCGDSSDEGEPPAGPSGPDRTEGPEEPTDVPSRPAGGGDVDEAVSFVPENHREAVSPLLVHLSEWPADAALKRPEGVEEGRSNLLVDLARPLVAESLFPSDPAAALATGEEGKLYLRLGDAKAGPYGQVSIENAPQGQDIYAVAFRWTWPAAKPTSFDAVRERLRSVSGPEAVLAFDSRGTHGSAHPTVKGEDGLSATFLLDRSGLGMMYNHVLVYATPTDLLVVYQQVPTNR